MSGSTGSNLPRWALEVQTPLQKSRTQERGIAKKFSGRVTVGSGNKMESGDVSIDDLKIKIEAKRTDKQSISIKKEWLTKAREELLRGREPVFEIEIDGEAWYMITRQGFANYLDFLRSGNAP